MSPVRPVLPFQASAAGTGGAARPRAAARRAQDAGADAFLLALGPELAAKPAPVVTPARPPSGGPMPVALLPAGPGASAKEAVGAEPLAGAAVPQLVQGALLAYAASRPTGPGSAVESARGAPAPVTPTGTAARLVSALSAAGRLLRSMMKPVTAPADAIPSGDVTLAVPAGTSAPAPSRLADLVAARSLTMPPAAMAEEMEHAPAMPRALAPTMTAVRAGSAETPAARPANVTVVAMAEAAGAAAASPAVIAAATRATKPEPSARSCEDGAPLRQICVARPAGGPAGPPIAGPAGAPRAGTDARSADAGADGRRAAQPVETRSEAAVDRGAHLPVPTPAAALPPESVAALARTAPGMAKAGLDPEAATAGPPRAAAFASKSPAPANRVTLQFSGEEGLEGRLRIALRGNALHATIVARDPDGARQLEAGLGELRQALGERGFSDARLAVQGSAETRAGDAPPDRQEQHASHHEDHAGRSGGRRDGDLDTSHENPRRRSPRRQSER